MIKNVITKLLKNDYPVQAEGRRDVDKFIHWGEKYTTYENVDGNDNKYFSFSDVIIHFPITPIKIESYSLKSIQYDIYPTHWKLYGSLDKSDWLEVSDVDKDLCNLTNQYKPEEDHPKIYCNLSETHDFDVTNNYNTYFYYFKFQLIENSYIRNKDPWFYATKTCGFEISGNYLIPFFQITYYSNDPYSLFLLFTLINCGK